MRLHLPHGHCNWACSVGKMYFGVLLVLCCYWSLGHVSKEIESNNSFSKSSFRMKDEKIFHLIEWRISCTNPTTSSIWIPYKKPNFSGEITLERMGSIQMYITLDMALYISLHGEIGWKCGVIYPWNLRITQYSNIRMQ